jgi:pimeloyl-ACP methyl ester carboxylesterase
MRWLTRPLRKIFSLLLMFVIAAAILVAMFRVAADVRESADARTAAGEGALFATVDGRQMHYKVWGPDNGRAIVLIHGTLAWSDTFRDIAEPLGALGYRVIAPDLPPFGFSERPEVHHYSRAAQAKRINDFAEAIGVERYVIGVHSYGGGAAVEAAFTKPAPVDGLVLMDVAMTTGTIDDRIPMRWVLDIDPVRDILVSMTLTNPMAIGPGLRAFVYDNSIVTRERIALYRKPMVMSGTTRAIGRWLDTGLLLDESKAASADPARYRSFERPVLVIWGKQDSVTPLIQGEGLASAFPNTTLEVLDGVNHIPHIEKPAEVVRLVDAFMKALPVVDDGKGDRLPAPAPGEAAPGDDDAAGTPPADGAAEPSPTPQ